MYVYPIWFIDAYVYNYIRVSFIRINWDSKPSRYAENTDLDISLKIGYTGNLKFYMLQNCTVLDPIIDNFKAI